MSEPSLRDSTLQDYIENSNLFYENLLGYKPEQTSLQQIPESQWSEFTQTRGLNPNSLGIYLPRNQTAIIRDKNPLSLFHEYFGHGLYCEQSLEGRKLVDLERRLLEEEKREFEGKQFTLEDIEAFRNSNQTAIQIKEFRNQNLGAYESFAVFTEYFLSREFNMKEAFEQKYELLSKQDRDGIEDIVNFNRTWGDLATMYAQGMARRTIPKRVRGLLGNIYKEKLGDVKFALLYGSRKDFSDIDVFMVGNGTPNEAHSDWLDVKYKSHKEFTQGLKNFDVRILNPLMNGEFIFGDKNYFEQAKQQIQNQQITEEAIKHNLKWSSRMQRLKDENLEDDFLRNKFEGYSQTYLANALALRQGLKLFSKEDLLSYSQQEKLIELKGGNEKNAT